MLFTLISELFWQESQPCTIWYFIIDCLVRFSGYFSFVYLVPKCRCQCKGLRFPLPPISRRQGLNVPKADWTPPSLTLLFTPACRWPQICVCVCVCVCVRERVCTHTCKCRHRCARIFSVADTFSQELPSQIEVIIYLKLPSQDRKPLPDRTLSTAPQCEVPLDQ